MIHEIVDRECVFFLYKEINMSKNEKLKSSMNESEKTLHDLRKIHFFIRPLIPFHSVAVSNEVSLEG